METKDDIAVGSEDQDKSGTNNQQVKMVPESDLIAAKRSLETKVQEKDSEITTLKSDLGTEKAAREAAESKVSDVEALTASVEELKVNITTLTGERDAATTSLEGLSTKLLETRRASLVSYGYPVEKVNDMNEEGLRALESVAGQMKTKVDPPLIRGMGINDGGGGTQEGKSALEKIGAGLPDKINNSA